MSKLACGNFLFYKKNFLGMESPKPEWYKIFFESPETFIKEYFLKKDFLSTSAFYPCSWGDDRPINLLAGFVYSFIYCDIRYSGCEEGKESYKVLYEQLGHEFGGYRCIYAKSIPLKNLTKENFTKMNRSVLKKDVSDSEWENFFSSEEPTAVFCVLKRREGDPVVPSSIPDYVTITFVKAEACHFYHQFYNLKNIVPKVIFSINPGDTYIHDISFDWNSEFLMIMRENKAGWPPFLFLNDFPNFDIIIRDIRKYKDCVENDKNFFSAIKELLNVNDEMKYVIWETLKTNDFIKLVEFRGPFVEPKGVREGPFGVYNKFYSPAFKFRLYHFPFSMKNSWKLFIEFLDLMAKEKVNETLLGDEDKNLGEQLINEGYFNCDENLSNNEDNSIG